MTASDGRLDGILTTPRPGARRRPATRSDQHATPRQRLVTASPGIDLDEARELLHRHRLEKLPLLDDDGFVAGLVTMRDLMALRERPRASKDDRGPAARRSRHRRAR